MLHTGLVNASRHIIVLVANGGSGISRLFDIPGNPPHKAAATLRVLSLKQLPDNVTWIRYRVFVKHTR